MSSLLALNYTDNTQFGDFGYEERRWTAVVQAIRELQLAADPDLSSRLAVANNLSDLSDAGDARDNLGLGTMATQSASDYLAVANNLSDLSDAGDARDNLGLGTMATQSAANYLSGYGNLSGVFSAAASRGNLGLGTLATQNANAVDISGGTINWVDIYGGTIDGIGSVKAGSLIAYGFLSSDTATTYYRSGMSCNNDFEISSDGSLSMTCDNLFELVGKRDSTTIAKIGSLSIDISRPSTGTYMYSDGDMLIESDGDMLIESSDDLEISSRDLRIYLSSEYPNFYGEDLVDVMKAHINDRFTDTCEIKIGSKAYTPSYEYELDVDVHRIGFFGVRPEVRQVVEGSRSDGSAFISLLLALSEYGLIHNSTSP